MRSISPRVRSESDKLATDLLELKCGSKNRCVRWFLRRTIGQRLFVEDAYCYWVAYERPVGKHIDLPDGNVLLGAHAVANAFRVDANPNFKGIGDEEFAGITIERPRVRPAASGPGEILALVRPVIACIDQFAGSWGIKKPR